MATSKNIFLRFGSEPRFDLEPRFDSEPTTPQSPPQLTRQTNEWIKYVGNYPSNCAKDVTRIHLRDLIGRTPIYTTRHILQSPVSFSRVCDKVNSIYIQLEIFAENGLITLTKVVGGANLIYKQNEISIRFYFVEETNMFHAIIRKRTIYTKIGATYPDMHDVSSLIYCLRMIFITPGIFTTFDFELNSEDIQRASPVTNELSLIRPEKNSCSDEAADWLRGW